MQHSYEGLDPVGGFDRVGLLAPLAHRDYRLLAGGMSVSLLGDGLFLIALAWPARRWAGSSSGRSSASVTRPAPATSAG